jgi:2-polyprenyl-6-methoxyphenol hydroxylase-like FAD-dependent oxidoreductase
MMCGLLLARAGIEVDVLEKHGDFLRDFRGDTIHPSTLELMRELGYIDEFLKLPHQKVQELNGAIGKTRVPVADFSGLDVACPYIVFMPQWNFLNFLADKARQYPNFHLRMETEANDLLQDQKVIGVRAQHQGQEFDLRADLVIGADGRHSVVRKRAGLQVHELGAPMDVLWMKVPRKETDPSEPLGIFRAGRILILIYRGDYWQCGFVIPKGQFDHFKESGLRAFQQKLQDLAPFLGDAVEALQSWDDIKLLTVKVDRLETWYAPGLLCIGDAAHAMSPIGGVGINLAIQDAVAAANLLQEPLREGLDCTAAMRQVQWRRGLPTRVTQRLQLLIQDRVIKPTLTGDRDISLPWILRFLLHHKVLTPLTGRLIGLGIRPEHVNTEVGEHKRQTA